MTTTARYTLTSCKGTREMTGTLDEAIAEAKAMEEELQPSYGITVSRDGEPMAEVRDGEAEVEEE